MDVYRQLPGKRSACIRIESAIRFPQGSFVLGELKLDGHLAGFSGRQFFTA
jgi:hypothetical protein